MTANSFYGPVLRCTPSGVINDLMTRMIDVLIKICKWQEQLECHLVHFGIVFACSVLISSSIRDLMFTLQSRFLASSCISLFPAFASWWPLLIFLLLINILSAMLWPMLWIWIKIFELPWSCSAFNHHCSNGKKNFFKIKSEQENEIKTDQPKDKADN